MNQLTVRGFDEQLAESVRRVAQRDGTSLNKAALKLLRMGAGLSDGEGDANGIGSSLDDLFGTWSREEAELFNAALDVFEVVDESTWKWECYRTSEISPLGPLDTDERSGLE